MPRLLPAILMSCTLAIALAAAPAAMALTLSSPAFANHGSLPARFTCTGKGISPPLSWHGAPRGTRGYTLILTDPDAPDPQHPPTHTFVHWVIAYLPAATHGLAAGQSGTLPTGSRKGANSRGRTGFTPPCPPAGRHRYIFTLYALDTGARLAGPGADRVRVLAAIRSHVLARTRLIATFRHRR